MSIDADPVVGCWYRRLDRPQPFQVVAFDAVQGTVDITYFDGTVDEWPIDHWRALALVPREAPQDWRGPFDVVDGAGTDDSDAGASAPDPLEGAQDAGTEPQEPLVRPDRSRAPGSAPATHAPSHPGRRRR